MNFCLDFFVSLSFFSDLCVDFFSWMTTKISIFSRETRDTKQTEHCWVNLFCLFLGKNFQQQYFSKLLTRRGANVRFLFMFIVAIFICVSLRADLNKDVYLWPRNQRLHPLIRRITSALLRVFILDFSILLIRYNVLNVFWGFRLSPLFTPQICLSYLYPSLCVSTPPLAFFTFKAIDLDRKPPKALWETESSRRLCKHSDFLPLKSDWRVSVGERISSDHIGHDTAVM